MNRADLVVYLQAHKIPICDWGRGEAKTVDHLLSEINSGEATIEEDKGLLLRVVSGATVVVFYQDKTGTFRLFEEKQVFNDGRERERVLEASIGEKMKPGEESLVAAYRALQEELGIHEKLYLTQKPVNIKGPIKSISYPGMMTKYISYPFEVVLPAHLYKPQGYLEKQADKTTYFVWRSV